MSPFKPRLIRLARHPRAHGGFLSCVDCADQLPFDVKRVYWLFETPLHSTTGQHAHRGLEQVLVAVAGRADIELENELGEVHRFTLTEPSVGLYVPPMQWGRMSLANDTVLVCFASQPYKEHDYIRDYAQFRTEATASVV